jgi:xeroderma pigmentosum group C-complementing protein
LSKSDLFGSTFISTSSKDEEKEEQLREKLSVGAGAEKLRSPNSLMKKVLQQEGSRDVSAQLFVSLARACGLGARLIVSLQAVPWRAEKSGTPKKKPGAGRNGQTVASRQGNGPPSDGEEEEEDEFEEVQIPGMGEEEGAPGQVVEKLQGKKGKGIRAAGRRRHTDPADVYRLKKAKPAPVKPGDSKTKKKVKDGECVLLFSCVRTDEALRSDRSATCILGRGLFEI